MKYSIGRLTPLLLPTLAVLLPTLAGAQSVPTRTIQAEPSCEGCRIVFDTIAIVGSIRDSVLIGDNMGGVLVMGGDTVVVAAGRSQEKTLVFTPDGRLARAVGRIGQGPGEISTPIAAAGYIDNQILLLHFGGLAVMDLQGTVRRQRRVSVTSTSSLEAAPDGRILYAYPESAPEVSGFRYQIRGPDLELIRAFDPIATGLRRREYEARNTAWSLARPDHFWSAPRFTHRIELWTEQGEPVEALRVEGAGWIGADAEAPQPNPMPRSRGVRLGDPGPVGQQRPRIIDVVEDEQGLLWVTGLAVPEPPLPRGTSPTQAEVSEWYERRWNTVVEVIDPVAGQVLATWQIPNRQAVPTNGLHYYLKQQSAVGVISYVVLRARLVR